MRSIVTSSPAKMTDLRNSGKPSQYFDTATCAISPGPGRPRSMISASLRISRCRNSQQELTLP